jgi:hypothetical protein
MRHAHTALRARCAFRGAKGSGRRGADYGIIPLKPATGLAEDESR